MSTPAHLNLSPSPFPLIELKEDHQQLQYLSTPPHQASSSSISSPIFINITDQDHPREPQKNQREADKYILYGGSSDHQAIPSSSSAQPTIVNNSNNNVIRTCSDCNTTKTPLWRSGPQGPKSLCNACGIRQRKARRAMLAAANGMALARATADSTRIKVQNKEKKSRCTSYTGQYKKKAFKHHGSPQGKEKISFEDFAMSLSKNSAFRRAFPKDEEEAAILLMALSCGLLHS
ncbi:unnamed protein product [Camellia sinensis]|uniref:putative GATA transcription factor 22 n=1 Tax=Camellia sinensis TaxID=4442 RepID=UPI001035C424|nr:putative GATA transcription factor 22 [Camellia sinensis]